jgi:hypothetical protein
MQTSRPTAFRPFAFALAAAAVALTALVLASARTASAAAIYQPQPPQSTLVPHVEEDGTPLPTSVATPIKKARAALANAIYYRLHRKLRYASIALANVRLHVGSAHTAAMAEIGAPPADPESDDLPGPPSVIAVLALERTVVVRGAPLYQGLTTGIGLAKTLATAQTLRTTMLNKVVSLDPEGAGADYADGMADTVPSYTTEVNAVIAVLNTNSLTSTSRTTLTQVLTRSRQARAVVTAAFGGGE